MSAAPVLNILRDGQQIGSAPIEGDVMLGREEGCVIRLDDRAISRQHAVFRAVTGGVQVEKKSTFAPLSVNGAECTRAIVKEGDVVAIGPFQLRLAAQSPATRATMESPGPVQPILGSQASAATAITPLEGGSELKVENVTHQMAPPEAEPLSPGDSVDLPLIGDDPVQASTLEPALSSSEGMVLEAVEPDVAAEPGENGGIVLDPPVEQIGEDEATRLAPTAQMKAVLSIEPGAANITELDVGTAEISLGRGKECDIVLETKKASRKHAIVRREGARFIVQDLDSANGTYVNGRRIKEMDLTGDDEIRIGGIKIHFKVENPDYHKREAEFMKVEPSASGGIGFNVNDGDTAPLPLGAMPGAVTFDPQQPDARSGSTSSGLNIPLYSEPPGVGVSGANTRLNLMGLPGQTSGGLGGGIPGLAPAKPAPKGFVERYRNMPPKQKAIWTVFMIVFVWWYLFDDGPAKTQVKTLPKAQPSSVVAASVGDKFSSLSAKDQAFIVAQHQLAFDLYKNRDYDLCLHELEKIFAIVDNYKDSREIERYAREGKRKLDAQVEENKKREEEERLKAHVAQLVDEASVRMSKKQYEQATQLFYEILSIEPDNAKVSEWKKQIEAWEEEKARAETEKQVQVQINERAKQQLDEGLALKKAGKCRAAVPVLAGVKDIGASDTSLIRRAQAAIQGCRAAVIARRTPLLAEAKTLEDTGELKRAFDLYRQATVVDPDHPEGYRGMQRIRGVLRERSRLSYAEGVMAESYSDFVTAKQKFQEVLSIAPDDDLYHDRAKRKLGGYLSRELANDPSHPMGGAP